MTAHSPTTSGRAASRAVFRVLDVVEKTIGSVCILIILALVSLQVFQRLTSGTSFAWSGEIAKYAMIWMTYVPIAYLLRRGLHLKLDVIDQWLGPRGEAVMSRITDALIGVIALGLVAAGWALLSAPILGTSPAAQIPLVYVYAGPVIGLALLSVCAFYLAIAGRTAEEPVVADLEPVIGEIGGDGRVVGTNEHSTEEPDDYGAAGGTGEIGEARP